MDFLKYLDVLIGITVVMILLSPGVTALTQLCMFAFNSRSKFLLRGLTALIQQLAGAPMCKLGQVRVITEDGQAIDCPQPQSTLSAGSATFEVTDRQGRPLENVRVSATFLLTNKGIWVESETTNQDGKASASFQWEGSPALVPYTAVVTVLDGNGKAVSVPRMRCQIASGHNPVQTVEGQTGKFLYPEAPSRPTKYEIECTLTVDGTGKPGCKILFSFDRNTDFDVETVSGPTDQSGKTTISAYRLTAADAHTIAKAVLLHPMICKAEFGLPESLKPICKRFGFKRDASGEVVQREELTRILLEFAAQEGAGKLDDDNARKALVKCLRLSDIPDPARALVDIRNEAQRLEKDYPNTAAHVRAAQAIITGAKSCFVGRINAWFDQTMERVTARYAMEARVITVATAFFVAFVVQIDSLDLIRRLSVDDKLRNSLLAEAKARQDRVDKPAPSSTTSELEAARASRDEVERNLAKLRDPQLSILPDHFIWQHVPQARLLRNPNWIPPLPDKFELLVGSSSFPVSPRWRRDAITDLRDAIIASKAPVTAELEEEHVLLNGDQTLQVKTAQPDAPLFPLGYHAQARLMSANWTAPYPTKFYLFLNNNPVDVAVASRARAKPAEFINNLHAGLKRVAGVTVTQAGNDLLIAAKNSEVLNIELRWKESDPATNILNDTEVVPTGSSLARPVFQALNISGAVRSYRPLLVTSHRLGPLQLRYVSGKPETNILNAPEDALWIKSWPLSWESLLGVLISWMLLSLGAPFWYDALKDMLKLRSSLASKEESQRVDRQTENPSPAAAATPPKK